MLKKDWEKEMRLGDAARAHVIPLDWRPGFGRHGFEGRACYYPATMQTAGDSAEALRAQR